MTSRQPLGIPGEWEFPVGTLPLPTLTEAAEGANDLEILAQNASVALFVDRAQAKRADFQVTVGNAPAITALCSRLEGIPLALELAAARAKALTPGQMLTQLEHRFDFLVSHQRDAEPRHHTLRAALDWSCDHLPTDVRRHYAAFSVFRGGWTIEAAEAVAETMSALHPLEQLRDLSLVEADEGPDGMRFRTLETVREHAAGILEEAELHALRRRHAAHFATFAERAEPGLIGPEQAAWLNRLEADHDNLRAAIDWCVSDSEHCDAETGLRLAAAAWRFWHIRGHLTEGRERLAAVLQRSESGGRTTHHAKALNASGVLAWNQGDYSAARSLYHQLSLIHI